MSDTPKTDWSETLETIAQRAEHRANQLESELAAALADAQRLNDALSKAQAILDAHRTSANINGIPETSDYANGWNACRQEAYQKRQALIELIDDAMREEKP